MLHTLLFHTRLATYNHDSTHVALINSIINALHIFLLVLMALCLLSSIRLLSQRKDLRMLLIFSAKKRTNTKPTTEAHSVCKKTV